MVLRIDSVPGVHVKIDPRCFKPKDKVAVKLRVGTLQRKPAGSRNNKCEFDVETSPTRKLTRSLGNGNSALLHC